MPEKPVPPPSEVSAERSVPVLGPEPKKPLEIQDAPDTNKTPDIFPSSELRSGDTDVDLKSIVPPEITKLEGYVEEKGPVVNPNAVLHPVDETLPPPKVLDFMTVQGTVPVGRPSPMWESQRSKEQAAPASGPISKDMAPFTASVIEKDDQEEKAA
jgi:hypothetical protein